MPTPRTGISIVGAAGSVGTILVQSHYQSRRELRRMAFDAAIEDHKAACDIAKTHQVPVQVAALTAFLHFHGRYLELLDKGELLRLLEIRRDGEI
jgi:hypothetical protein